MPNEVRRKVKMYYVKSLRRVNKILLISSSDLLAKLYSFQSTQQWYYCVCKVYLLDKVSRNKVIGYVVDELDNNVLVVQYLSNTDSIKAVRIKSPHQDTSTKQYAYVGNSKGLRFVLKLFEPIIFCFNLNNPLNNFCFFC